MLENDFSGLSELDRYKIFELDSLHGKESFGEKHIKILFKIAKKSQAEKYRKVSLRA